jgi:hypothetical protein
MELPVCVFREKYGIKKKRFDEVFILHGGVQHHFDLLVQFCLLYPYG